MVGIWLLDPQGRPLATLAESGSADGVAIPLPALVHALASSGATFVYMAHTHPSGDPRPSDADIDATRQVWRVARMLGASLQDHVIFAGGSMFSFRHHGLL